MAWKNVLTGAARSLLTPRQLSGSFMSRTRTNHHSSGFEPLFPAVRSNGNIPPSIGFGLLMEAVVAAFRGLTVVSVGLLVSDLIHGTEATRLRNKMNKDIEEVWKSIEVTEKALEETRASIKSLKISRDSLMHNLSQQSKLMEEFQRKQEKAMQDFKTKSDGYAGFQNEARDSSRNVCLCLRHFGGHFILQKIGSLFTEKEI